MPWEPVDQWPGESADKGDPFRAASEPIVATRGSRSLSERVRGFLASTDEERAGDRVERITLTSRYVYVERADGSTSRAPRSAVIAFQQEGPVVRYGVEGGDDFSLYARDDCGVQRALVEQLGSSAEPAMEDNVKFIAGIALLVMAFTAFVFLQLTYYDLRGLWEAGLYTSEGFLWLYTAVGFVLANLALWAWLPTRTRFDTLGVHRFRGMIPWLRWHVPVDEFTVEQRRHELVAVFDPPRRFGTFRKRDTARLFGVVPGNAQSAQAAREADARHEERLSARLHEIERALGHKE